MDKIKKVMTVLALVPEALLKACQVVAHAVDKVLAFLTLVVKPITDGTKTNKDNAIQVKIVEELTEARNRITEKFIPALGKLSTLINKWGL